MSSAAVILWLHVMAAMFWLGGQLFLFMVLLPVVRHSLSEPERVRIVSLVGRRFGVYGGLSLAVLLVTGLLNANAHGVSASILRDSKWGHVLIAKIVLVAIVLVLTCIHGAYYGPRLEQSAGQATSILEPERRKSLQLRSIQLSVVNLFVNVAIVALAVWLSTLA